MTQRNVINSDEVGLVYDRTEDDKFEERELFNIEADPGRLIAFQKELKNGIESKLEKHLASGLKSSGCELETAAKILAALPTVRHEKAMMKWMVWHIKTYGDYPPPHLYPKALKIILRDILTEAE